MKRLNQLLVLVGLILITACSSQKDITEEQVKQFIKQVDTASASMDTDSIANAMSENVIIKLNIHTDGGTQKMEFKKPEYIDMLSQGWGIASEYTFIRSNVNINISGNKATITSDLVDELVIDGTTLKSSNKDTTVVEMLDNKMLVTNVFVDSIM